MRSLLAGFTTRGKAFLAAGVATGVFGVASGQPALLSIGGLLVFLPLLSVVAARRSGYRFRCARAVTPVRVPAGDTAVVEAAAGRAVAVAGPAEPPSRIHGDCWSGNVLWSGGRGVLVDPAAHGDRKSVV